MAWELKCDHDGKVIDPNTKHFKVQVFQEGNLDREFVACGENCRKNVDTAPRSATTSSNSSSTGTTSSSGTTSGTAASTNLQIRP